MNTKALKIIKDYVKDARGVLESTMADVTEKQAHFLPPNAALPIGALYAHVIVSEDWTIQSILKKATTLAQGLYATNSGISEPMPAPGEGWEEKHRTWARSVNIDLPKLKEYAQAVYAATDEYLASLTEEDLDRPVDLTSIGGSQVTLSWLIGNYVIIHTANITGEISTIKGIQGLKGYPF